MKDALADVVSDHKTVACKVTDPKKICLKAEAGNINDDGTPTNEVLKCSDQGQGEQEEKSSELGIGEPHLPSMSGDESDESDIVEHDVSAFFLVILNSNALSMCFCLPLILSFCILHDLHLFNLFTLIF